MDGVMGSRFRWWLMVVYPNSRQLRGVKGLPVIQRKTGLKHDNAKID